MARVWTVFLVYLLAFAGVVAFTVVAAGLVRSLYPDRPDAEVFTGLPGLLAGGLASSSALLLAVGLAARPLDPAALRLRPGRERGRDLVVMVVGTLALAQTLDSLTTLAGWTEGGALALIRRALAGAVGAQLFAAVVVIGVLAGAAEEIFFRGWMQARLRACWPPWAAVTATSLAFGLMHLDPLHGVLAVALGLWLGAVTEHAGSALPAVVAHVANNTVFTLLTATAGAGPGPAAALGLGVGAAVVFAGCVGWLVAGRRRGPAG